MEQRRLLIAFAVSLLLLVAYQEFVVKRYQKPRTAAPGRVAQGNAPVPQEAPPPPPPSELAAPEADAPSVDIETDLFRARITAQGARLAALQLKEYRGSVAANSAPLELVQPGPVLPLTLQLDEATSDAAVVYRAARPALAVHGDERGEVVFTGEGPGGLRLEKRYTFTGRSYLFEVTAAVAGDPAKKISAVGFVLTPVRNDVPAAAAHATALALAQRRLVQKSLDDLRKQPTPVETSTWAGFAAQYFLAVAISDLGPAKAVMSAVDGTPIVRVDAPVTDGRASFDVYVGPKDREVLAAADHDLDRALDFGWFWFIAIPLLQALRFLHRVTGNYGVAIIVLTTLVKVATIPLTQTTFRNMREMQKIQPQMAKLRERFKDDQVALQKEMMELYRRHRVNPFSGCLPMVLQIPIFVGLYNTLSHAIELRHAPFAFWINDLSSPDRLMVGGIGIPVLTLLMGASMFLQQWLTPQQGDPTQQRMMMFMPLVFTFMFINFPAGLVLYWLVNNVLTIGQQYFMMRSSR
jgi:YidC/Oxa1 family membrane protein insertase